MDLTTLTARQRVVLGIDFLNQHGPKGWFRKVGAAIRAKKFDISIANHCVLGEVYGDFYTGQEKLNLEGIGDFYPSIQYGFDSGSGVSFEELQAEWISVYNEAERAAKAAKRAAARKK